MTISPKSQNTRQGIYQIAYDQPIICYINHIDTCLTENLYRHCPLQHFDHTHYLRINQSNLDYLDVLHICSQTVFLPSDTSQDTIAILDMNSVFLDHYMVLVDFYTDKKLLTMKRNLH